MNIDEFNKVKGMNYNEYCDYLQNKYGIGVSDYMTKSFNINPKCKRTKDGLLAHHKAEDKAVMLSNPKIARDLPFEWQTKENIVYCDYLEHLFLHVLICKYPSVDKIPNHDVGIGGVINFLVPELNDFYSGWVTNQEWRKHCHDKIKDDLQVYLEIIKIFLRWLHDNRPDYDVDCMFTSFNEMFGGWSRQKNRELYGYFLAIWEDL